jgi:hypothetical protein
MERKRQCKLWFFVESAVTECKAYPVKDLGRIETDCLLLDLW